MISDVGPDRAIRQDIIVRIRTIDQSVPLPHYSTDGAAGADVHAWIQNPINLLPGERHLIPTGLFVEIPFGFEIQVRSRSGLAIRDGLFVVNSPGTIDSDYRGEIKIILGNIGENPVTIQPLERIAQLVICPVIQAHFEPVTRLSDTARASGGFGSSGR